MAHNQSFTGVLAVLHATSQDGRRLDEPNPELSRPLPVPLVGADGNVAGRIDRVWRDGNLIRYSGALLSETAHALVQDKRVVGNLDAVAVQWETRHKGVVVDIGAPLDAELPGDELVAHDWLIAGATLGSPEQKAWPEVELVLEDSGS
ncbi:hypothetical protein AB0D91_05195 [Streptomyces canus]|uniref:hypothetical protein n=1 Tax=Streptomyces canus TaxID=58343 RepID=UPI0033CF09CF